ncbi:carbohydrate sulfotransferase 13-like [Macrobrachium rosenbergii]|uniref:carbohydrate sulfotransferase 13-like n=1 Tax=Macrobrachium rosenbergii TaxID=79674 RepID=UPI0034D7AA6F
MLAARNFKSIFRLVFLTIFTTYSILYTLSYVNNLQPSRVLPRPSPYMNHYRGSQAINQSVTEVTPKEITNVNNRTSHVRPTSGHDGDLVSNVTAMSVAFKLLPTDSEDIIREAIPSDALKLTPPDQSGGNNYNDTSLNSEIPVDSGSRLKSEAEAFYDDYADLDVTPSSGRSGSDATEDDLEVDFSAFDSYQDQEQNPDWPVTLEFTNASALRRIDYDKYSTKDRGFLQSRLDVFEERAALVGKVCKQQPASLHTPSGANHLVWDTKHSPSIVWCPNYKVASTTMMMSFLRISSKSKKVQKKKKRVKQSDVRRIYWAPKSGEEKATVLRESVRVIIVRHPFTRILSAYRDKMTKMRPGPPKFHFRKMQKDIIAKYRPADSSVVSPFPTFPEFVSYIIDATRSLTSTTDWKEKTKCWTAYWAHCNVCTTDYNVIMKLETLDDDKRFLVTLSDLDELKEKSPEDWLHLRNATSHDLAPKYYSQLTRDQILALYDSYKLDFELFDYHIDEYLSLV